VGTFVEFSEVTPEMAVIKELTEFDKNSEDDIQELRKVFEYGERFF